jgi:hypothetical protein
VCILRCFAETGYCKFDNSAVLSQLKTFEYSLVTRLDGPKISMELKNNLKFSGVTRIGSLQETPSSVTWQLDVWVNKTGNVLLCDSERFSANIVSVEKR